MQISKAKKLGCRVAKLKKNWKLSECFDKVIQLIPNIVKPGMLIYIDANIVDAHNLCS